MLSLICRSKGTDSRTREGKNLFRSKRKSGSETKGWRLVWEICINRDNPTGSLIWYARPRWRRYTSRAVVECPKKFTQLTNLVWMWMQLRPKKQGQVWLARQDSACKIVILLCALKAIRSRKASSKTSENRCVLFLFQHFNVKDELTFDSKTADSKNRILCPGFQWVGWVGKHSCFDVRYYF